MESKPRVLIPYRNPEKVNPYVAAARSGGAEPVPLLVNRRVGLDGFAGLILTGGTDVNPRLYGEAVQPETDLPDDERDEVELALIREAIEKDLPLFAICRGLQVLNVYHGGALVQHLPSGAHKKTDNKAEPVHDIAIEPDTILAKIANSPRWPVNSRHHQAIAEVGAGLLVSARDPRDGIVEALERPANRFILAVQWHPEDQIPLCPEQLQLFQCFAEACAGLSDHDGHLLS
ncbi:MAG: gamma-glutamyl-gamma-aminobutyrate hydrolase family protein, partial [Bryobacteraceae bacterium]